ncbi:MAG: pyridoxal-phosphate dependent enzyme, partial [Candidatus Thorarchaeota archaeon]|nr:pyridoxal-phosphate dependent enzyme [Candidatus Thorarchaeota archaeon]
SNLSAALQCDDLWMKRDDLTSETYGGNKIRKLEFIIAEALKMNKKWILTFGGIGSNHALATAIYGRTQGIKTLVCMIDQPVTQAVREKLLLCSHFGAKLSYAKNIFGAFFKGLWHLATKRGVYFLWMGGSNTTGILGHVNAAFELTRQIEEGQIPSPKRIFIPVGTMGTYAGLKVGLTLAGIDADLVGVKVTDLSMANEKELTKMINKTFKFLHDKSENIPHIQMQQEDIHMVHDFVGEGYGYETPEGADALSLLEKEESVIIDPTYTAKAFAYLLKSIRDGKEGNGPTLFWNTYNSAKLPDTKELNLDCQALPRSFHKFFKD